MKSTIPLLLLTAAAIVTTPARAILIDFESPYTAGDLRDQPGGGATSWGGSAGWTSVVAGAGVGGSNGAVTQVSSNSSLSVNFAPTASDFGGTSTNPPSPSLYTFSLDVKYTPAISADGSYVELALFRQSPGSNFGLRLRLEADGDLRVVNGSGTTISDVFDSGSFVNLSGSVNYTTSQATLSINGGAAATYAFIGTPTTTGFLQISNSGISNVSVAFDNIALQAVPEPAALGLLGLGMVALLPRNIRRK